MSLSASFQLLSQTVSVPAQLFFGRAADKCSIAVLTSVARCRSKEARAEVSFPEWEAQCRGYVPESRHRKMQEMITMRSFELSEPQYVLISTLESEHIVVKNEKNAALYDLNPLFD